MNVAVNATLMFHVYHVSLHQQSNTQRYLIQKDMKLRKREYSLILEAGTGKNAFCQQLQHCNWLLFKSSNAVLYAIRWHLDDLTEISELVNTVNLNTWPIKVLHHTNVKMNSLLNPSPKQLLSYFHSLTVTWHDGDVKLPEDFMGFKYMRLK